MAIIQGFVLTGGASRRMGRDKALLLMNGKTLAQRAVDTLREFCSQVFTVGGDVRSADAPNLRDIAPPFSVEGRAAMVGVYTALRSCTSEFAAILACDMPNVTASVFHVLLKRIKADDAIDAAVPMDEAGNMQQLCSVLRPTQCLAAVERLPAGRTPSIKDLLRELNVKTVEFAEFSHLDPLGGLFANLNTAEDLPTGSP